MSRAELSAHAAARRRLADLEAELAREHPQIYRHLALYLQVLRDHLLNSVHQACFHLVTQVHPHRYGALAAERRIRLQHRLAALVRRTRSLLTVEQLTCLAQELQVERQQRLLEAIQERQSAQGSQQVPSGSINLGLNLPLSSEAWTDKPTSSWLPSMDHARDEDSAGHEPCPDHSAAVNEAAAGVSALPFSPVDAVAAEDGVDASLLPGNPILLLEWLESHELALSRRLRNLSHAINVELLRHGVSSALLPMSVLDGVMQGQVELQAAPPGILCLNLPFPDDDQKTAAVQACAVLLRLADLEHGHPPLRTCRNRLRQAAQQVRRMAHEFASLQRRLATLEAEELWLLDVQAVTRPLP